MKQLQQLLRKRRTECAVGAVKDWWGRGQASVRAAVGRASQPSSSCLCWGDARDDEEVDERGGGTPRSILFFSFLSFI